MSSKVNKEFYILHISLFWSIINNRGEMCEEIYAYSYNDIYIAFELNIRF